MITARIADAIRARDELAVWLRCPLPELSEQSASRQQSREFLMGKHVEYNALSVLINGPQP
jgi:hypothetical protein